MSSGITKRDAARIGQRRRGSARAVAALALTLTTCLAVAFALAQEPSPVEAPFRLAPTLTPQVITGENIRVVPPTPSVRVSGDRAADLEPGTPLRSDFVQSPDVDALEAARERRAQRDRDREAARAAASAADDDGADLDARRETVRERMRSRSAQAETGSDAEAEGEEEPSGRSQGSLRHAPGARGRHGDGARRAEREREYGRLIIVTSFEDDVRATVDGEPYPYASLDGVLLVAGYQYDVVIERGDASAAPAPGETSNFRTIPVRVEPGETRILMATLSDSSGGVRASTPRTREPTRASRRDTREEEEEEEEIGYLGVSSTPVGTIWIDGENIGQTTPARRIELEPGRHEVRIFYDSEDEFSETKNVLIRAGVNTNVFFRQRRDRPADEEE